jgi:hypothetical protein
VLQRKGHSAGYSAKTGRALRNRLLFGEMRLGKFTTALSSANVATRQAGLARVPRKVSHKYAARTYGFLNKSQRGATRLTPLRDASQAVSALERKRLHYRELKFYHNRPKLRLPELTMTRRRKRKAGLATFTRDSLLHTRSAAGQARSLLPPTNIYSSIAVKQVQAFSPVADTLVSYVRRDDLSPVF